MESSQTNLGPGKVDVEDMRPLWGWFAVLGVVLIVLGAVAIVYPIATSVTMATLLGVLLVIGGISQGIHGIMSRHWKGFLLHMLAALLYVVVGFVLLANPGVTLATFTLILGIYLVIAGLIKVMSSFMLRSESGWGWLLFGGIIDFILGALIWANWPSTASWVIGLLVGISLFFTGWSMLMIGIAARMVTSEARDETMRPAPPAPA